MKLQSIRHFRLRRVFFLALFAALGGRAALAAEPDLAEAEKLFRTGQYQECIDAVKKAMVDNDNAGGLALAEGWWVLKVRAQLAIGKYPEALRTIESGLDMHDDSVQLRLLGYDALRFNDRPEDAAKALLGIRDMAEQMPWRFTDAASRVALGRAFLRGGADPRKILELYYDPAKKSSPNLPDAYFATGELALLKQDDALAADSFRQAMAHQSDDPDIYLGLAKALDDDPEQASAALAKALSLNPNHVESLLYQVDNLIDREDFTAAGALLKKVLEINPKSAQAWAYRAVIAHLNADHKEEAADRDKALETWSTNPEVDYLIGHKLSQNYRFSEGATYQKRALAFAPDYTESTLQYAEDLLRLGREDEGWERAAEAFKADPYSVLAYNLVTLHDSIAKYATIQDEHFIIRMDKTEAPIYGQRVLRLLSREREKMQAKYDIQLTQPTLIEIFSEQKDFAIRTFGMPGGGDFLGVCFGPVVTVNSPASRGANPSNWEATLWHEFCHTITLTKTHNKMPRWISEGISVYEERQENPSWGQAMSPTYREMILGKPGIPGAPEALGGAFESEITPVSKLSSAFLMPKSPTHLMFAYYESSMVINYINTQYGADAVKFILKDLGDDLPINEAIGRHTEPIDKFDPHFAAWLKDQAEKLAPGVDWEKPKLAPGEVTVAALGAWNEAHPNSFAGLMAQGDMLLTDRQWRAAVVPLEKALALYPNYSDADGPLPMLAAAHHELGEIAAEKEALEKFAALNADAIDARTRLMRIAAAGELTDKKPDWPEVLKQADQALAITPMLPEAYRNLAHAAEALDNRGVAIDAFRTLLQLDPINRIDHHYHLAKLLFAEKQLAEARHEVVLALEEAPRFREAHALLLQIAAAMDAANPATIAPPVAPEAAPALTPATQVAP